MPPRPGMLRPEDYDNLSATADSSYIGRADTATIREQYMRECLMNNYSTGSTGTATPYYSGNTYAVGRLQHDVGELIDEVAKLSFEFSDTLQEALKQVGMSDYKERIQKEFKSIIEQRLTETVNTIEKAYRGLNERINEYEKAMKEKLDKLDQESVKRKITLDKIDFLAKELGYQMEIANKSF